MTNPEVLRQLTEKARSEQQISQRKIEREYKECEYQTLLQEVDKHITAAAQAGQDSTQVKTFNHGIDYKDHIETDLNPKYRRLIKELKNLGFKVTLTPGESFDLDNGNLYWRNLIVGWRRS
jgi:hypothetical protein